MECILKYTDTNHPIKKGDRIIINWKEFSPIHKKYSEGTSVNVTFDGYDCRKGNVVYWRHDPKEKETIPFKEITKIRKSKFQKT